MVTLPLDGLSITFAGLQAHVAPSLHPHSSLRSTDEVTCIIGGPATPPPKGELHKANSEDVI